MKKFLVAFGIAAGLLGMATPSDAWWRGGWWYGPYPYWYGPPNPYVYAPPVVVQPAPPPVSVQPAPQQQYWYWCEDARTYYPYVQACPSGWMQVLPQMAPPAAPR